ncbi:MAG: NADH-quinone oxidoreductase subunit NuoI, partial [Anaerolineae bacterium]|nr:NADH-quinone oxidoreductase subunit NuoI [Anaerolineae bacterium]
MNVLRGFATTFKHVLEEPVTVQYPEQTIEFEERYKGRHELKRYDNGLEKCIGCALCAAACPADAIWVEAAENTDEARFSPGERYAKTYEINMLRCIYCGYCEDACPTEAIVLGHEHRLSFTDRRDAIFTKEMLIDPAPEGLE